MNHHPEKLLLGVALALVVSSAQARTEDRSQRAEFRAGQSRENAGVMEFSRGFQLNQGSLEIKSDSARRRARVMGRATGRWQPADRPGQPY